MSSISYIYMGSEGVACIFNPLYVSVFLRSCFSLQLVICLWFERKCLYIQLVICLWVLKELLVSSISYISLDSLGVACIFK